jgi:hypothetical protein
VLIEAPNGEFMILRALLSLCFVLNAYGEDPAAPPVPAPETKAPETKNPYEQICRAIEQEAANNDLPVEFFTRLIWQESKFDINSQSSAGAQGIAQFMPGTAMERGLTNPFEPLEALKESAAFLHELFRTFGNLGLAAAAYNAGPGRVARWRAGRASLPSQTVAYVRIVTGHSVAEWASANPPEWKDVEIPRGVPCDQLVQVLAQKKKENTENPEIEMAAWKPWGVQLGAAWQQGRVLASFEQIRRQIPQVIGERQPLIFKTPSLHGYAQRYIVRLGENTRSDADRLCLNLQKAGGHCFVLANPR